MPVVWVSVFFEVFLVVFAAVSWVIIVIINRSWPDMAGTLYINYRWGSVMAMRPFYNDPR